MTFALLLAAVAENPKRRYEVRVATARDSLEVASKIYEDSDVSRDIPVSNDSSTTFLFVSVFSSTPGM